MSTLNYTPEKHRRHRNIEKRGGSSGGGGGGGGSAAAVKAVEEANAATRGNDAEFKSKYKGIDFAGEIDRLDGAINSIREIERTGKWSAGKDAQVGYISGLLQHADYVKAKAGGNVSQEAAALRNRLTRASMESAKLLYSKASEDAKNQIAKLEYERAFSVARMTETKPKRNNNPESKAIYKDLVSRVKKMIKSGELQDMAGEFEVKSKSTKTKSSIQVTKGKNDAPSNEDPFA
jgi:hypothetical protein